jgi:GDP-L-fucose synthase
LKKKILILGASGFIGKNIALNFSANKGFKVFGTYFNNKTFIKNVSMKKVNLTIKKEVDKVIKGKDIVIQAAAISSGSKNIISRPYIHVNDNAIINSMVTRSCYEFFTKHVLFFSCSIMYDSQSSKLQKEDDLDLRKIHEKYFGAAHTKIFIEKMCEFYSKLNRNKYTVVRHSNIYGPHDKFSLQESHALAGIINKVSSTNKSAIVWGNGNEKRDFLYISDLVNFVKIVLKKQKKNFGLYNIGSEKLVSINKLTDIIIKISKKKISKTNDLTIKSINTNICLDCLRARKELGWKTKVSLKDGVRRTYKWFINNRF